MDINSNIISNKISAYIRRYYLFGLTKGTLFVSIYLLAAILLLPYLEYEFEFDSVGRGILLFGFIGGFVVNFYFFIFRNILRMLNVGSVISAEKAAQNIGEYFPEIKDKLLNLLQLESQLKESNNSLLQASILQKAKEVEPFKFSQAIKFKDLIQYLKYAAIPTAALGIALFFAPEVFTESSERILNFDKEFEKKAPFEWTFLNKELKAVQYDDFDLEIQVNGDFVPSDLNILINEKPIKLKKKSARVFTHSFNQLNKSVPFAIEGLGYTSRKYILKVVPKAVVENFKVSFKYPNYIGKPSQEITDLGNFSIPEGTLVKWHLSTSNVRKVGFKFEDTLLQANAAGDNSFEFSRKFKASTSYSMVESNKDYKNLYPATYLIDVVPDKFPKIELNTYVDSMSLNNIYFTGIVEDDYGFKSLKVYYKMKGNSQYASKNIDLPSANLSAQFYYMFDLKALGLAFGEELEYYFEIRDNDALNGFKRTKSAIGYHHLKSKKEIVEDYKSESASLKSNMQSSMESAMKLQKKIRSLKEKLLSKKELSWTDKKELEQIKQQQEALKKELEKLLREKESIEKKQELISDEENSDLKEKQDQLQEMLEDLVKNEMDKMMERIEDLMEKLEKDDMVKEMDQLSNSNEQVGQELEKLEELYKKLEFEYQMQETINALEELAKEQEALNKNDSISKEDAQSKQEDIANKFDALDKQMDEVKKLNDSRERPSNLRENKSERSDVKKSLDKAGNQSQSQKKQQEAKEKAAEQMDELAKKMQSQMQQMEQEDMAVDYELLRQLLDNVLVLSFDQEKLLNQTQELNRNSPNYRSLVFDQFKLKDNLQMVKDSLISLSKRVFHVKSFVTKEVTTLETKMEYILNGLEQLKFNKAVVNQQYAITSLNNVALMLNESLTNMQNEMKSNSSQSSGSCSKPKSGQGQSGKTKQQIEQLRKMNEAMTKKMQKMKEGKGENGEGGKTPMSEGLAKLAKEQAKMRRLLQQLNEENNKDGKQKLGILEDILKNMEQNEKDIVNKKLSNEMIQRQKDIETRLLKAETALKERELKEERQAESSTRKEENVSPAFLEYKKKREKQIELLKSVPPKFQDFYRNLVNDYFRALSD